MCTLKKEFKGIRRFKVLLFDLSFPAAGKRFTSIVKGSLPTDICKLPIFGYCP
jgi:hypothetical protein